MGELSILYDGGFNWSKKSAGGIHIFEVCEHLALNNEVILFAPRKKDTTFNIHRFSTKYIPVSCQGSFCFIIYEMLLFMYLFLMVIHSKPDVIYARSTSGFGSLSISLLFNIPRIVEVNGLTSEEAKARKQFIIKTLVMVNMLQPLNYKFSSLIVAVTESIKKRLQEIYDIEDEKIVVIENGANTKLFRPLPQEQCINKLKLESCNTYVCFIGSLSPWQGIEHLIRATPSILNDFSDTRFLIVGEGLLKKQLYELVQEMGLTDKFIFFGSIPYEQVPLYINASSICVAPMTKSRIKSGSSALKIYEYLSCGTPVVSSRIPNLEFIEEERVGILVPPENPEELATAIITLLENKKLREEMGKRGREYVINTHSWEKMAEKVGRTMSRVL